MVERVLEEVVVTGIRSSLQRSMDVKRDSFGVVDAISAEDIGAFPDTNLAESLQRITGVAIDGGTGRDATDAFRIKIVDRSSDTVVYDNRRGDDEGGNSATLLGGGSILVHRR